METEQPVNDMLWQDKYRPRSTRDLVGNPGPVQTITTWLKSWQQSFGSGEKAKKGTTKAALLSGPPGLGKTSTATLVARECGYESIEFNASDTRSKKSLSVRTLCLGLNQPFFKETVAHLIQNR